MTATVALTAGAAFAAFGAGSSSATTRASLAASARPANKIVVLAYGDAQNKVEQWAVDTYDKTAQGKKVKAVLQTIPGANYQTKLQTIMGSSNAPDVFFNWGGGSIVQFQKAGLLLPLNSFMKADPKLETSFLPSI
ncbi:MAG: extracellular solute-binding protein, partial [Gaiellaceae bacterium]